MSNIGTTILVALQAVGTAATMTAVGVYMHRRRCVGDGANKTLAYLSRQVTIPALLFTRLVACDSSDGTCTSITDSFSSLWLVLIWPLVVVSCGLLVGWLAAAMSFTPPLRRNAVLASCGFGNSSGLVLTLLESISSSLPATSTLLQTDPTALVSVYMILFPILQWGIGGWLLAPTESKKEDQSNEVTEEEVPDQLESGAVRSSSDFASDPQVEREESASTRRDAIASLGRKFAVVASHFFQPPVVAAVAGLAVSAVYPVRELFVDVQGDGSTSPLGWLFQGINAVGLAAVPVNMTILGINLSKAMGDKPFKCGKTTPVDPPTSVDKMSKWTIISTVVGKMVIMPAIGIALALLMKLLLTIPENLEGAFYLVLMVVFITPTANNVMVMVELSGSGSQEDMAKLIAWQYAVSPVTLSLFLAVVVLVASS